MGPQLAPQVRLSSVQLNFRYHFDLSSYAAGVYPVTVTNPYGAGASNAVNFTVTGPTDFSISTFGSVNATISAGQTATFPNVISVSGTGGFAAQVNVSCSLLATATHCSVSPAAMSPGQNATVSATTTARGFVLPPEPVGRVRPMAYVLLAAPLAMLFIMLLLARTRRRKFAVLLPVAGMLRLVLLQMGGCGGGGGSTPPPPPPVTGTQAGTYTITLTATSGSLTRATNLTLIVQ